MGRRGSEGFVAGRRICTVRRGCILIAVCHPALRFKNNFKNFKKTLFTFLF